MFRRGIEQGDRVRIADHLAHRLEDTQAEPRSGINAITDQRTGRGEGKFDLREAFTRCWGFGEFAAIPTDDLLDREDINRFELMGVRRRRGAFLARWVGTWRGLGCRVGGFGGWRAALGDLYRVSINRHPPPRPGHSNNHHGR
jgi:hypothetical protein